MTDDCRFVLNRDTSSVEVIETFERVCLIMLNPSTADEKTDDPTIRKCIGFAKRWGASKLTVLNLNPIRATNPKNLKPIPTTEMYEKNMACVESATWCADLFVVAWGNHGAKHGSARMIQYLKNEVGRIYCLGKTKTGEPKHPLYVPYSTELVEF